MDRAVIVYFIELYLDPGQRDQDLRASSARGGQMVAPSWNSDRVKFCCSFRTKKHPKQATKKVGRRRLSQIFRLDSRAGESQKCREGWSCEACGDSLALTTIAFLSPIVIFPVSTDIFHRWHNIFLKEYHFNCFT